ncbi:MAG TPA: hypothetical protein DC042_15000 [Bacteroidales bacterium]|nr:hypothetical protein [Bacteroidales bacterium]
MKPEEASMKSHPALAVPLVNAGRRQRAQRNRFPVHAWLKKTKEEPKGLKSEVTEREEGHGCIYPLIQEVLCVLCG